MDAASFQRFEEELYSAGAGKNGLVIDVRNNGGGSTTDHLLTALTQPVHAITVPRGGEPGYPQDRKVYATWNKPIVVLCNQNSFSNAEIFSHAIKTLGRGQLVGVPTAGGVISTGAAIDHGHGHAAAARPRLVRRRAPAKTWSSTARVPHHVVWPEPGQIPAGKDVQIEKAVEVLLADVKKWASARSPNCGRPRSGKLGLGHARSRARISRDNRSSNLEGLVMQPRIINRGRGPEIEGTRITVYDVWDYLKLGWHPTEIAALFRIASDQVMAASEYIEQHRAEVLENYQRIVDRHRNYRYSPEVKQKLAQCQAKLQARRAELDAARATGAARAHDHGGQ